VEFICSDIFGSFAFGRFMNTCMLYLVNSFLKLVVYHLRMAGVYFRNTVYFFTYSMTMDKVLVNVSDFSFVKPFVKNLTCYKVLSACHKNIYPFNTHYKI
jgi:hypothetical protein